MNLIRIKIVAFWLSFLGLVALLYYSWPHRILWVILFLACGALTVLVGPRASYPRERAKVMRKLFGVAGFVFLFAFIVHGFLFPKSAYLLLAMKILMPMALLPALCYKAQGDYLAFRLSRGRSVKQRPCTKHGDRASADDPT